MTKEVRDVSGLGAREVLVVREVVHVHALQVRSLWRTETKKNSKLTSFWVCQSSSVCVCVYYCRTFYKAVRVGEEESGGHVL